MDAFRQTLAERGLGVLNATEVTTLQVNIGKRCNQACHHCHVEAGPLRTENMSEETVEQLLALLKANPQLEVVDITGGAPELNPHFRRLVSGTRELQRRVIDRCNLTVLYEPGQEDTADFLASHQVEIVASLPCYTSDNVDQQRGRGVFEKSVDGLKQLNALGYGQDPELVLNLVYNPGGAFLPPAQEGLQSKYRDELKENFGICFTNLFTMSNMPIKRFDEWLIRNGESERYRRLLQDNFNACTVDTLMCRSAISVGWDGQLYDCDFNQMLDMPLVRPQTVAGLGGLHQLNHRRIATQDHCFGCTAGAGSSCGGALEVSP